MAQIFISYSRKDLAFVQQLAADLKNAGFEVWYDVSGIRGGSKWRTEIEKGLSSSQFAIVVLSPDSTASEWVEREFLFASDLKLKIIPLYYRPCKLPLSYLDMNYIDVQGNKYRENFSKIFSALDPSRIPVPPLPTESSWEEIKKKLPVVSAVLLVIVIVIGAVFLMYPGPTGPGGQLQTEIPAAATQTAEARRTEVAGIVNMTQSAMAASETLLPSPTSTDTPTLTQTPTPTTRPADTPTLTQIPTPTTRPTDRPTLTQTPTPTTRPTDTPTLTQTPTVSVYEPNYNDSYPKFAGGPNRGGGSANIYCPSGYIATGLQGYQGDYITGLGLYCSLLNRNGTTGPASKTEVKGNNGGRYWDNLVCPPNKALTAINGVAGGYIDRIQGICMYVAYVDDPEAFETGWAGEGGEVNFRSLCDSGDYVTGLRIRWGDYIDGLTMICTPVLKK